MRIRQFQTYSRKIFLPREKDFTRMRIRNFLLSSQRNWTLTFTLWYEDAVVRLIVIDLLEYKYTYLLISSE